MTLRTPTKLQDTITRLEAKPASPSFFRVVEPSSGACWQGSATAGWGLPHYEECQFATQEIAEKKADQARGFGYLVKVTFVDMAFARLNRLNILHKQMAKAKTAA